jgi:hypothetical protein
MWLILPQIENLSLDKGNPFDFILKQIKSQSKIPAPAF